MKKILLTALLTLWPLSSNAVTIYFAGGEGESFNSIGAYVGVGAHNANDVRTSFARVFLSQQNGTSTADPPANRIQTPTFTAASTLWIHGQVGNNSSSNSTTNNVQSMIVRSPDGVARILLRQTGTAGTIKASTRNAAGTITDLATATFAMPATAISYPMQLDVKIVYGCTSSDQVQVYFNAVLGLTYTGASICTDAATTLNQVEFMSFNNSSTPSNSGNACNGSTCWSEIIISDSDTRSMSLWTIPPVASGNTQSWTPNTVGNINSANPSNNTPPPDINFISTSSTSALSQWTTSTTLPTGIYNVPAVVQEARVRIGNSGPTHFEWLCRSGGTDNVTGSLAPLVSVFSNFPNQIWATNCKTGSAWATTDITAGFNLGIESLP